MASKRAERRRRCTGKRSYLDREQALSACATLYRRGVTGLTPYRCGQCGAWHTGHLPAAVAKEKPWLSATLPGA